MIIAIHYRLSDKMKTNYSNDLLRFTQSSYQNGRTYKLNLNYIYTTNLYFMVYFINHHHYFLHTEFIDLYVNR